MSFDFLLFPPSHRSDAASVEIVAELVRISTEGAALVADALRELLAASAPKPLRIAEAAAALGLSKRTLQRALHEAGVTFSSEERRTRVLGGLERIATPGTKMDNAAREVGVLVRRYAATGLAAHGGGGGSPAVPPSSA